MPKKKNGPTQKQLRKVMSDSIDAVKDLTAVTEVGNAEYYRLRAIEFIRDGNLTRAIALLALAEVGRSAGPVGSSASQSGLEDARSFDRVS